MSNNYDYIFKYITIGNSGVGKSSIVSRYLNDSFNIEHEITLGVEFAIKNIKINNTRIKIQLWDTAGQECFKSITRQYFRESAGVILVYDIANRKSYEDAKLWLIDVLKANVNPEIIFIGNKNDLDHKREVTFDEGLEYAKLNNMLFTEISAKSNTGIKYVFNSLAENILTKIDKIGADNVYGVKKFIEIDKINDVCNNNIIISNNENRKCC